MAKTDLTPLVIRAQAGDQQALNDLLAGCYEDLYYNAYKTVQNQDLAADITQESCMEILSTLGNLREPGAFPVWARRIVYHQCTRYFRQTHEVTLAENEEGETLFDQLPDEREGVLPEQIQEDREFRALMQEMLDQLPAQQRTALLLYYYEDFSVSQIAHIQQVSEGTVKSRLNYGRKAVKSSVEAYEKKTGVRLYSAAPFALLLAFLFRVEKGELSHVAAGLAGALGSQLSAAAGTSTAAGFGTAAAVGGKVAAAGAFVGKALALKIVAAVAALTLTVGATAGIAIAVKNANETSQTETKEKKDKAPDMEELSHLVGPWYGEWYDETLGEDLIILQEDGSVLVHDHALRPVGIKKLKDEYSCVFGEFRLDGPSYQLQLKSDPQMTDADVTVSFLCMDSRRNRYIAIACAEAENGTCPIQVGMYYQEPQVQEEEGTMLELIQPFVGEWVCANLDGTEDIIFRLGEDGSVEFNGQIYYLFGAEQEEHESYSEYEINTMLTRIDVRDTVEEECQKALIIEIFQNVNGMYAAEVSALTVGENNDLYTESGVFFPKADLEGLEKIAITEENFRDYIYADSTYHAEFDQETQQWNAESRLTVGFYWECMAPACFKGDITYTVEVYTLRYDAVNDRELSKELTGTHSVTWEGCRLAGTLFFFGEISAWEDGEFYLYDDLRVVKEASVDENGIVTYTVQEVVSLRAENVRGYVYVPKN